MKTYKKEHFFKVSIVAIPLYYDKEGYIHKDHFNYEDRITLFEMVLSAKHYLRKQRFFDLKIAHLQNLHRDKYIQSYIYPFSKAGNQKRNYKRDRSISSTKAQITKIERAMADYKKSMSQTLFFNPATDKIWQKAEAKLARQKAKLKDLVKQKQEVEL